MQRFFIEDLPLTGLKKITRLHLGDQRGFLSRLFCEEELRQAGWIKPVVQINLTYTKKKGTVRGMHFQHPPHAEMKLVSCLRGKIFDVAVDIRKGSPTFLQWRSVILSAENRDALLIPEGFAHGFQSLDTDVEILYFHSVPYAPQAESGLMATDPRLGIVWPLPIEELYGRDASHPLLQEAFDGITI